MFFNKKRYKNIKTYPDTWSMGSADGLIIRICSGLKTASGHPDFPIKMGIAIPYEERNEEFLTKIEDFIFDKISDQAVLVAVINSAEDKKFTEFVCYSKTNFSFADFHQLLKDAFPKYEIQMFAEKEPDWATFLRLCN